MALTAIVKKSREAVDPKAQAVVEEIDIDGEILRFRTPKAPDLYPRPKRVRRFVQRHPNLGDIQKMAVFLMSSTYVMAAEDERAGMTVDDMFAEIAEGDPQMWTTLMAKHREKFPKIWETLMGKLDDETEEGDEDDEGDPLRSSEETSPSTPSSD
jgi:hypothetical protein